MRTGKRLALKKTNKRRFRHIAEMFIVRYEIGRYGRRVVSKDVARFKKQRLYSNATVIWDNLITVALSLLQWLAGAPA